MSSTDTQNPTEIRISPKHSWFDLDWRGLYDYRDLLFLMVRRDFVSRYQQTILGPLWFIINPLISASMNVLVLGVVIGVSTDGTPGILFFLSGQIIWTYFSTLLDSTCNTFVANAHLFGKVYFPRLVIPFSQALSNLINFGIQFLSFMALWTWFWLHPSDKYHLALTPGMLVLFPVIVAHMALLALGAGMIISVLTVKYRDFRYLISFLTQIWMMASAVWYPISTLLKKLPENYHWLIALNPMASIVEGTRLTFLGAGSFNTTYYLVSAGLTAVIFFVGLTLFQRCARSFIDNV